MNHCHHRCRTSDWQTSPRVRRVFCTLRVQPAGVTANNCFCKLYFVVPVRPQTRQVMGANHQNILIGKILRRRRSTKFRRVGDFEVKLLFRYGWCRAPPCLMTAVNPSGSVQTLPRFVYHQRPFRGGGVGTAVGHVDMTITSFNSVPRAVVTNNSCA